MKMLKPSICLSFLFLFGCMSLDTAENGPGETDAEVTDLVAKIKQGNSVRVLVALQNMENGSKAIPHAVKLLDDKDAKVRLAAIICLQQIGPAARSAIPKLIKCLSREDGAVAMFAGFALASIDRDSDVVIRAVESALKSENPDIRESVAIGLWKFGPNLKKILDTLLSSLSDPEWKVRRSVILALKELREEATPAIPHLCRVIQNREEVIQVKKYAARTLLEAGFKKAEVYEYLKLQKEISRAEDAIVESLAKEPAFAPSLSVAEVIEIANAKAVSEGKNLDDYGPPEAEFDPIGEEQKWTVFYKEKDNPMNHFLVWINDSDRSAEYMPGE